MTVDLKLGLHMQIHGFRTWGRGFGHEDTAVHRVQ